MVKTTFAEKMLALDRANQQAAELIIAEPHLHGGLGSLEVQWARAVLERSGVNLVHARVADSIPR